MKFDKRVLVLLGLTVLTVAALLGLFLTNRSAAAQDVCQAVCEGPCRELDQTRPEDAPWYLDRSGIQESSGGRTCWCFCCDVSGTRAYMLYVDLPLALAVTSTPTRTRTLAPEATPTDTPEA
ncbi:MAG: hypothetical protein OXK74_01460, partial [Gemmatimonadota bacterium]|nr:hypothetical protein [Gemmatimonadota bacterium]